MQNNVLATESFSSSPKRHYFLDFKLAANQKNFIQITRSEEQGDGSYRRSQVIIHENDFHHFFQGLSSLLHHAAYLDLEKLGFREQCAMLSAKPVRGIKSWEPDMRPREKMLAGGAAALSDAELLALLIGSGTVKETAVDLAARILDSVEGSLEKLAGCSYGTLGRFVGMGLAKCSAVIAAMELSRRLVEQQLSSATGFLGSFS